MNRAIIIHNENAGVERFACANIEPDDDIIKWVIIRKTPKFTVYVYIGLRNLVCGDEFLCVVVVKVVFLWKVSRFGFGNGK